VTRVKVCGVTTEADARDCVEAGVDAIGVNFIASSVRRVDPAMARAIVTAVGGRVLLVGVVANESVEAMRAMRDATGVECLQLHGDEGPAQVEALLPHAYKAVRVADPRDVAVAYGMPGGYVLVDAKVGGALGGTGHTFDWGLVVELAAARRVVLAGGLTPENVADAVRRVRPWCVDVASGVESAPGRKDPAKVRAFLEAARSAC
jgi:phosphoribosylanthranilate isomerase